MPHPDSAAADLLNLLTPIVADAGTDTDILLREWHADFPLPWLDEYLHPIGSFHQVHPSTQWHYWGLRSESGSSPEPCPHWLVYGRWRGEGKSATAKAVAARLEQEGFSLLRRQEMPFEEWSDTSDLLTHINAQGQWQCSFHTRDEPGDVIAVQVQHLAKQQLEFIGQQTPIELPFPPLTLRRGETLSDWQGQDPSDHFSAEFRTVRVHISGPEQTEFAGRMQNHLTQSGWRLLTDWAEANTLVSVWQTPWGQSLLSIGATDEQGLPVRWVGMSQGSFKSVGEP